MTQQLFFNIATLLVSVVGIYLIVRQLSQTKEIHYIVSERDKLEDTLEVYNSIRVDMRKRKDKLKVEFGIGPGKLLLTKKDVEKARTDRQIAEDINTVLDYLHRLATGVRRGMYDFDLLNELSGVQFIKTYQRLEPYVEHLREEVSPKIYGDIEVFIDRLKEENQFSIETRS